MKDESVGIALEDAVDEATTYAGAYDSVWVAVSAPVYGAEDRAVHDAVDDAVRYAVYETNQNGSIK